MIVFLLVRHFVLAIALYQINNLESSQRTEWTEPRLQNVFPYLAVVVRVSLHKASPNLLWNSRMLWSTLTWPCPSVTLLYIYNYVQRLPCYLCSLCSICYSVIEVTLLPWYLHLVILLRLLPCLYLYHFVTTLTLIVTSVNLLPWYLFFFITSVTF